MVTSDSDEAEDEVEWGEERLPSNSQQAGVTEGPRLRNSIKKIVKFDTSAVGKPCKKLNV